MQNNLLNKHRLLITALILAFSGLHAAPPARLILNGAFINITQGAQLVIENPAPDAITRISGHIISEGEFNMVRWNIGTNTGHYEIPWGNNIGYFPLSFIPTGAVGDGYFNFSTYPTPWNNSSRLPTGITQINNGAGQDNSAFVIDRFWRIDAKGYTSKPTLSNVVFTYLDIEHSEPQNTIVEQNLRAQRYNDIQMTWADYPASGTVNTTNNTLTIASIAPGDLFQWWTLYDVSSPLPISLVSFTAISEGEHVRLNWVTQAEQDNDYFTIEKSLQGIVFEFVAEIDGAGTNNKELKYTTVDPKPWPGISYYRLKQTDFDGKKSYSKLVSVKRSGSMDFTLNIYPNPISGRDLNLQLHNILGENIQLKVYNLIGKEMYAKSLNTQHAADFSTIVELPDALTAGVYFLKIECNDKTFTKRIVLQ